MEASTMSNKFNQDSKKKFNGNRKPREINELKVNEVIFIKLL